MDDMIRIIAVEDERVSQLNLERLLQRHSSTLEFLLAEDAESALDLIPIYNPDIILMDLVLPGMDGYEASKKVKQDDPTRQILAISSAIESLDDVKRLVNYGIDDFIKKPASEHELLFHIGKLAVQRKLALDNQRFDFERKESRSLLEGVYNNLTTGICISGIDGSIKLYNQKWLNMFAIENYRLKDPHCFLFFSPEINKDLIKAREKIISGEIESYRDEIKFQRADNSFYWGDFSVTPIFDANRQVYSFVYFVTNITERIETEEKLRESQNLLKEKEERYSFAMESANEGIWDWDVLTGDVIFNDQWYNMLGFDPFFKPPSLETFKELIHPEDRKLVLDKVFDYINKGGKGSYCLQFRMLKKNGASIIVQAKGKCVEWDDKGSPKRLVGTHTDINELVATRKEIELLIENVDAFTFRKDERGRYTFVNRKWSDMLGMDIGQMIGRTDEDIWSEYKSQYGSDFEKLIKKIKRADEIVHNTKMPLSQKENIPSKEGLRYVISSRIPIFKDNEYIGISGILFDYTNEVKIEELIRVQRYLGISLADISSIKEVGSVTLDNLMDLEEIDFCSFYKLNRFGEHELISQRGNNGFDSFFSRVRNKGKLEDLLKEHKSYFGTIEDLGVQSDNQTQKLAYIGVIPLHHDGKDLGFLSVASEKKSLYYDYTKDGLVTIGVLLSATIARLKEVNTDKKSGLYSRDLFDTLLNQRLQTEAGYILMTDINGFTPIKRNTGQVGANKLIREVGIIIQESLPRDAFATRIGGDVFLSYIPERYIPLDIAKIISQKISQHHFYFKERDYSKELHSTNVVVSTAVSRDKKTLEWAIERLCERTKLKGRDQVVFPEMTSEELEKGIKFFDVQSQLDQIIQEKRFSYVMQPILYVNELDSEGKPRDIFSHWEALLREQSINNTEEFIRIVGDNQLAYPLHEAGLNMVLELRNKVVKKYNLSEMIVSFNCSSILFEWENQDNLREMVFSALQRSGTLPSSLCLEITEDAAMSNYSSTSQLLSEFRSKGIKVALDDFGKGYTNIERVVSLPVDTIKIDKGLVLKMKDTDRYDPIIGGCITQIKGMGRECIAEGVENLPVMFRLMKLGVDGVQGYGICRPGDPFQIIEDYLNKHKN